MRSSVAGGVTRRRPAPRSASSRSATSSGSGSRAPSGPSCGASTTAACARASTCASFPSRTGPRWTFGSTSSRKGSKVPEIYFAHERDVFKRNGMWLSTGPHLNPRDDEPIQKMACATARWAT